MTIGSSCESSPGPSNSGFTTRKRRRQEETEVKVPAAAMRRKIRRLVKAIGWRSYKENEGREWMSWKDDGSVGGNSSTFVVEWFLFFFHYLSIVHIWKWNEKGGFQTETVISRLSLASTKSHCQHEWVERERGRDHEDFGSFCCHSFCRGSYVKPHKP